MTTYELRDYRRELERAVAFFGSQGPASSARSEMRARLDAVLAEQDDRARIAAAHEEGPDALPPDGGGDAPEPDLDEVRNALEHTRHLRLAMDLLEESLPASYSCDGFMAELWALREKVAAAGPLIAKAAEAVKTLDDLGLVIRLA